MWERHAINSARSDSDIRLLPAPPPAYSLIDTVRHRLSTLGFCKKPPPLDMLHHALPPETMTLNEHYSNAVSRAFYAPDKAQQSAYFNLLQYLYQHVVSGDFLFQVQPIVRFHFPVPFPPAMQSKGGLPRQLHSDILGGHPPRMLQGWLALTDCTGSAALQCSSRADGAALLQTYQDTLRPEGPPFADSLRHFYDAWDTIPGYGEALSAACHPVAMNAGEVLLFDPHCIHGGTENTETKTRVSLDFRMLPVAFERETAASAKTATQHRFCRGDLFHAQSAKDLFG